MQVRIGTKLMSKADSADATDTYSSSNVTHGENSGRKSTQPHICDVSEVSAASAKPHFWSVMRALFAGECESGELAACLVQYAETGFPEAFADLAAHPEPSRVRRVLSRIYRKMAKEGHTGLQESVAADPRSFDWLEPYIAMDKERMAFVDAFGPRDDTDRRVIEHCAEQDLAEAFGERAAVMEYDGGLTREQAERAAAAGLVPEGWSASAWHERLTHMAEVCINPERAAELKNMVSALTTAK